MQIAARTGSTGLLALLALVTLLASIPGQSADPGPDPRRADELRVEFMLPFGPARDVPTVDVLFSRPMRALGTETRGDESSLLRLDPPVPGRFMWVGSRALRFVPERPFPRATSFRATVPQGIADAAGKTLAAPATWTFSTPAPALTAIRPAPRSRHLAPGGPIFLAFDQPVDLERVRAAVTLAAGRAAVATTCTHPDSAALAALATPLPAAARDAIVLLRPQSPLPRASAVTLTIAARPLAAEGPLPFAADSIVSFTTYGPLALVAGEADADGLTLELTNPVDPDSLCARLRLFGPAVADSARPVAHGRAAASRIPLGVRLAPGRPFRVQVLAGLRDTFGQTLAAPATLDLVTQDLDPMLEIRPDHAVLEARAESRTAIVRTTNVEHVIVRAALLSAAQAAFLARRPWAMASGEIDPFAGLRPRERAHRVVADRNRPGRIAVDLGELIPPPGGGFVLLSASAPGCLLGNTGAPADTLPARYSLVQITDLGLMAKVSASDILVWATSLRTGEPLARVDLEIVDEAGAVRWRGRTGEDGLAKDRTPAPWERAAGWTLVARRGRDQTILGIDTDWELSPWSFDLPGDYANAPGRADAFLFSDRELYRPGETVRVKAIVRGRDRNGLGPAPLDSVQLKVMGPYGAAVSEQALRLSAFGTASAEVPLGNAAPLGYYWATLEPLGADPDLVDLRGSFGFRVEAFRAAAFKADLALAGPRGRAAAGPAAPLVLARGTRSSPSSPPAPSSMRRSPAPRSPSSSAARAPTSRRRRRPQRRSPATRSPIRA